MGLDRRARPGLGATVLAAVPCTRRGLREQCVFITVSVGQKHLNWVMWLLHLKAWREASVPSHVDPSEGLLVHPHDMAAGCPQSE